MKQISNKKSHDHEQIKMLEQRISIELNNFLVLSEEGDPTQIAFALCKAKREFVTLAPEMHRISEKIGGDLPYYVADYIESVDSILHSHELIDEETINSCLSHRAKLKEELRHKN